MNGSESDLSAAGYRAGVAGNARLVSLENEFAFLAQQLESWGSLCAWSAAHPEVVLWKGRGRLYVVPRGQGQRWVIRWLRHGGVLARITGDRFLRWGRPRSVNELAVSLELAAMGIPTPQVVAACTYVRGPFYRGEVVRRAVEGRDLAGCLFGASASNGERRARELRASGELVARLSARGVFHPDLNLRNILIGGYKDQLQAYLLDLEKCRLLGGSGERPRLRMLARFQRSAQRFGAAHGRHLSPEDWEAFFEGYHAAV